MYNVRIDPVLYRSVPEVFLCKNGTREGRSANYFCNLRITLYSWVNQSVPFGFFI